jgi:hypothetical protein
MKIPLGLYRLLAGERRLRATQQLGHTEIEARIYDGPLTAARRLKIELAENTQRLDMTPLEQSRLIARIAALAREAAKEEPPELRADSTRKPGRPPEPGSYRDIERRTSISESTIRYAEAHVKAVEKYPDLKAAPQHEAITVASVIEEVPEEDRPKVERCLKTPDIARGIKGALKEAEFWRPSPTETRAAKQAKRWPEQDYIHTTLSKVFNFPSVQNATDYVNGIAGFDALRVFLEGDLAAAEQLDVWLHEYMGALRKRLGQKETGLRRIH